MRSLGISDLTRPFQSIWSFEPSSRSIGADDGALDILLAGREDGGGVVIGALGIAESKYAYWVR